MTQERTPTQKLLDFVCDQEMELDQYPSLLFESSLMERFIITKSLNDQEDRTKELIAEIIHWENHQEIKESLEFVLNQKFVIQIRKKS